MSALRQEPLSAWRHKAQLRTPIPPSCSTFSSGSEPPSPARAYLQSQAGLSLPSKQKPGRLFLITNKSYSPRSTEILQAHTCRTTEAELGQENTRSSWLSMPGCTPRCACWGAGMLQARPGPLTTSASKSLRVSQHNATLTPQKHQLLPPTPPPHRASPQHTRRCSPSSSHPRAHRRAATYKPEQLPQLSLPPGASLSTVRFLPSTAGAAPCSSNSSASGDPHSHASPAIFATNTSLTQRAPRRAATSQTRHVRAASHPPPDVSTPHLT